MALEHLKGNGGLAVALLLASYLLLVPLYLGWRTMYVSKGEMNSFIIHSVAKMASDT